MTEAAVKTVRHALGGTEEMTLDDARSRATAMLDPIKRGNSRFASDTVISEYFAFQA